MQQLGPRNLLGEVVSLSEGNRYYEGITMESLVRLIDVQTQRIDEQL